MSGAHPWAEATWPALGEAVKRDPVVVLPVGSLEQHGLHLPLGTDTFAAEAVARAAAADWDHARPLLLMPALWTGLSPHHMGLPGSVTLRADTFVALLEDVCASVLHHGVRRLLVLNGHGGNVAAIDVALTKLGERGLDLERVVAATYWQLLDPERVAALRDTPKGGTGHAGEFETSLMLATHGALVASDEAVSCYPTQPSGYLSSDLFQTGPAKRYMPFDRLSSTGTLGDPTHADEEKGRRILAACAEALRRLLEDLASW